MRPKKRLTKRQLRLLLGNFLPNRCAVSAPFLLPSALAAATLVLLPLR